jgi:2-dehydro-3-deoxygluconokinase
VTIEPAPVVTFGEALVRLTPAVGVPIHAATELAVDVGGAEVNVAVALAALGERPRWVSGLPANPLGELVRATVAGRSVDVTHVTEVGDARLGLYFYEPGVDPRAGRVVYDRAGSAFTHLDRFPVDALDGAGTLHLSGITPALGAGPAAAARMAVDAAVARGVCVSFDLNHRSALATPDEAATTFWSFATRATVVFVNVRDGRSVLGLSGVGPEQAAQLRARLPGAVCVVTRGADGAIADDGNPHAVPAVPGEAFDRLGRGDAFCAGFLYGWRREDVAHGLRCGVALAALQQTYRGDLGWSNEDDLLSCLDAQREVRR